MNNGFGMGNAQPFFNTIYMSMPNEQMALQYPVAPGNLIAFKIDNGDSKVLIEKSMSLDHFGKPICKRYKLIEEEIVDPNPRPQPQADQITREDLAALRQSIESINSRIEELRQQASKTVEVVNVPQPANNSAFTSPVNAVPATYTEVTE